MSVSKKISERVATVALIAAAMAVAIAAPLVAGNQYYLQILVNIGINIILVLGLNVITGLAGQLSLCQGAFFGIGAYACALLVMRTGISFWLALPLAALGTAALGLVISIPALRLRGHYLAMLTLAFAVIVSQVLTNWVSLTRGPSGLINIPWPDPLPLGLFTINIANRQQYYVFVVVAAAVMIFLACAIQRSRFGMSLKAIREDEVAAEIMGIDTRLCKMLAFGLSGFFGAVAGGIYAHYAKILTPDEFGVIQSVNVLLMLIIGGSTSVLGAVTGAAVFTVLPEALRVFADYRMIVFGTVLILSIIYFPSGIAGTIMEWFAVRRRAARRTEVSVVPPLEAHRNGIPRPRGTRALSVENISKRFGGLSALNGVSIDVQPGEIVGLIGPNGSGKTTLINIVSGAYDPSDGQVVFGGKVTSGQPAHLISRAGISRTFQKIRLFRNLSVFENVAAALYPDRVPRWLPGLWTGRVLGTFSAMQDQAHELLATVGLLARRDDAARNLSYGEQRMLEIARALATHPQVILLDEPAAGLSAIDVEFLRGVIGRIKQNGIAIVIVDHHTTFLMSVVDRLVVLNQGRLIFAGLPAAARRDAGVIEAYLGTAHDA